MLSTMADVYGELVENAATVQHTADTAEDLPSELPTLDELAELHYQAERCLEFMRQRPSGSL